MSDSDEFDEGQLVAPMPNFNNKNSPAASIGPDILKDLKKSRPSNVTTVQDDDTDLALVRQTSVRTAAKRQKVKLHEVDRGAKCTICKDCPGFELHYWRKLCNNCSCSREEHEVEHIDLNRRIPRRTLIGEVDSSELSLPRPSRVSGVSGEFSRGNKSQKGYDHEEAIIGWEMVEKTRDMRKVLAHQDPVYDHEISACVGLSNINQVRGFQKLEKKRTNMYRQGTRNISKETTICHRSKEPIVVGEPIVEAPLDYHKEPVVYHETNFTCNSCNEPLGEQRFYTYENEISCGRCHAEKYMPRCKGCDELIFDPTYTVAEGAKWHVIHFCCWVCDVDLCEKKYAKDEAGNPCCLPCYNNKYAQRCATCDKLISAGERAMRAGDRSYHDSTACFKCKTCEIFLKNEKCVQYQGSIYCSPCYHQAHSPPCGRCGERIRGEFVEVKGVRYKKSCFNCFECGVAFSREPKKGAYPLNDKLLCYTHALAQRQREIALAKTNNNNKLERNVSTDVAPPRLSTTSNNASPNNNNVVYNNASTGNVVYSNASPNDTGIYNNVNASTGSLNNTSYYDMISADDFVASTLKRNADNAASRDNSSADVYATASPTTKTYNNNNNNNNDAEKYTRVTRMETANFSVGNEFVAQNATDNHIRQGTKKVSKILRDHHPSMPMGDASNETAVKKSPRPSLDSPVLDRHGLDESALPVSDMARLTMGQQNPSNKNDTTRTSGAMQNASDPFAALWAGFVVPLKLAKFKVDEPGRAAIDIDSFVLVQKKTQSQVFLVLCTDIAMLVQLVEDGCYELMLMPVERNKVKAKIMRDTTTAFQIKMGKRVMLEAKDETSRSQWIGKLNAPVGFIPTAKLRSLPAAKFPALLF